MPLVCMVKEMGEQRPRHELVNGPQLCRNSKTKHRTAVLTPSRGEASHDRIAIGILEIRYSTVTLTVTIASSRYLLCLMLLILYCRHPIQIGRWYSIQTQTSLNVDT